jgi:hypothetical protein
MSKTVLVTTFQPPKYRFYDYSTWIRKSLEKNGYKVRLVRKNMNHNSALIEFENKKIIVDFSDYSWILNPLISQVDEYYSANISDEIIKEFDIKEVNKKEFTKFRAQYKKYSHKIKPLVIGRNVKKQTRYTKCIPSSFLKNKNIMLLISLIEHKLSNKDLVNFSVINEPKQYLLGTFSAGCGDNSFFGKNRQKIYKIIEEELGTEFVHITPEYKDKKKYNLIRYDYSEYLKFLSSCKFVLNLSGLGGSNPFRCVDACLSNSCILSDKIYANSYKSFPRIEIPVDVQKGKIDLKKLRLTLKDLKKNQDKYYKTLIIKQKKWFEKNLSIENNCNQIL